MQQAAAAGGAIRIDLEDDYEKITTGKLTFTKTVTGGVTQEEAEGALTFTIQNETTGKYLAVSESGAISWVDTETALLLGTLAKLDGYTVTGNAEKNSAIPGFDKVSTSAESGSDTLAAEGAIQIDLEDDYEKITTGKLTFTKSVTGGVTKEEAEGALTFTIQNETTGKYLAVSEAGEISWVEEETELSLELLSKLEGYTVTGDAENGFLFKVVLDKVEAGQYEQCDPRIR